MEKLLQSLPQALFTASEVAENEAQLAEQQGITMLQLMELAGQAVFERIQQQHNPINKLLIFAGKGNNGGDGYVVARLAAEQDIVCELIVLAEKQQIQGDAKTNLHRIEKINKVSVQFCPTPTLLSQQLNRLNCSADTLIVDALLGTGFKGELAELFILAINWINQQNSKVVAIDLPSGLYANTGTSAPVCVQANETVTFIGVKQGLVTGKAARYVGSIYYADLHLGKLLTQKLQPKKWLQGQQAIPKLSHRDPVSHKGNIGLAICIGGNKGMPGAIRLASEAALRCGASLVAVSCHQENQQALVTARPELMLASNEAEYLANSTLFEKAKVLLAGPGLGRDNWSEQMALLAINSEKTTVLDADALYFLAKNPHKRENWVLTPHPGEAATLLGITVAEVEADRYSAVQQIVAQYGGICVLKGAGSLICNGCETWVNTSGNAGMASGGMGDVLSGIMSALLMQMRDPFAAARLAVYLHGKAADLVAERQGARGILASDLFMPLQYLVNH